MLKTMNSSDLSDLFVITCFIWNNDAVNKNRNHFMFTKMLVSNYKKYKKSNSIWIYCKDFIKCKLLWIWWLMAHWLYYSFILTPCLKRGMSDQHVNHVVLSCNDSNCFGEKRTGRIFTIICRLPGSSCFIIKSRNILMLSSNEWM
jgi:hypothetical protein